MNTYNLTPIELTNLERTVDATVSEQGFMFAPHAAMINLLQLGLVECNPAIVSPTGDIAFKATVKGHETTVALGGRNAAHLDASQQEEAVMRRPVYDVVENFQLPVNRSRRHSVGGRAYPFDTMALNAAIFIPSTEARPDPKKALASTISSANKRYLDFVPRRYFILVRAEQGQKFGNIVAPANGAYIVRVEPPIVQPDAE